MANFIEGKSLTKATRKSMSRHSSIEKLTKEELLQMLKEYKIENIKLLEDKRLTSIHRIKKESLQEELLIIRKENESLRQKIYESDFEIHSSKVKNNKVPDLIDFNEYELLRENKVDCNRRSEIDLKNTPVRVSSCDCGSQKRLDEVITVNHIWQKDYTTLFEEHNNLKMRLATMEKQLEVANSLSGVLKTQNQEMREYIDCKEGQLFSISNIVPQKVSDDEVTALQQQSIIFKEDYLQEVQEKKELEKKYQKKAIALSKASSTIEQLSTVNNRLKDDYRRANLEKDHIVSELRRLSATSFSTPLSNMRSCPQRPETSRSPDLYMLQNLVERDVTKENLFEAKNTKQTAANNFIPAKVNNEKHIEKFEIKRPAAVRSKSS